MTTSSTQPGASPDAPPHNPYGGLKRPLIVLGVLLVIWLIMGKIVPFFFAAPPRPLTNSEIKVKETPVPVAVGANGAQEITVLREQLAALEARLKTQEELLLASPSATPAEGNAELNEWQASVEARLAELTQNHVNIANDEKLAMLEERINNQQESMLALQLRSEQRLAALHLFHQMKEQLARGEKIGAIMAKLRQLVPPDDAAQPLLAGLAERAEHGVSTQAQALKQLQTLIGKAVSTKDDRSLLGRAQRFITIRKSGDVAGGDDGAILARAENRLQSGDLRASLAEIDALSSENAPLFAEWKKNAVRSIEAAQMLADLEAALLGDKIAVPIAPVHE